MPKPPEEELEKFLQSLPLWLRKGFEQGLWKLAPPEMNEWEKNQDSASAALQEYEKIVRRVPGKWRQYRNMWGTIRVPLPANRGGRPRNDDLADEAQKLRDQ